MLLYRAAVWLVTLAVAALLIGGLYVMLFSHGRE